MVETQTNEIKINVLENMNSEKTATNRTITIGIVNTSILNTEQLENRELFEKITIKKNIDYRKQTELLLKLKEISTIMKQKYGYYFDVEKAHKVITHLTKIDFFDTDFTIYISKKEIYPLILIGDYGYNAVIIAPRYDEE